MEMMVQDGLQGPAHTTVDMNGSSDYFEVIWFSW
jgi:hypothetical protein